MVARGEPGQRAADDGQELRAEHVTDARQAGDDRSVIVGPKDAGHVTINVGELAVEVEHGLGESHDGRGGGRLAGDMGGSPAGGIGRRRGQGPAPRTPRRFSNPVSLPAVQLTDTGSILMGQGYFRVGGGPGVAESVAEGFPVEFGDESRVGRA